MGDNLSRSGRLSITHLTQCLDRLEAHYPSHWLTIAVLYQPEHTGKHRAGQLSTTSKDPDNSSLFCISLNFKWEPHSTDPKLHLPFQNSEICISLTLTLLGHLLLLNFILIYKSPTFLWASPSIQSTMQCKSKHTILLYIGTIITQERTKA